MQRAIVCLLHVDYRPLATTHVHITSAGVASIVLYIKISLLTLPVPKQLLQYVCETQPTARLLVSWHVLFETYIQNNYEQHYKKLRTSHPCRRQSPVLLILVVVTQFCSNLTTFCVVKGELKQHNFRSQVSQMRHITTPHYSAKMTL